MDRTAEARHNTSVVPGCSTAPATIRPLPNPVPLPSVPIASPDISRFRAGNTGVSYAWRMAGASPGPNVLLTAIVHGNEACGAIALARLLDSEFTPDRGSVTAVFANVDAYHRSSPALPWQGRYIDEDLNRIWDPKRLAAPADTSEHRRAKALKPLVDEADILLDLHSMHQHGEPLLLAGSLEKGVSLARAVGQPRLVVRDRGHLAGPRLRDYRQFGDPASPAAALLVECGQHADPGAADVAWSVTWRLLSAAGVIDTPASTDETPDDGPQTVIEVTEAVTAQTERFRFLRPLQGIARVPDRGTLVAIDGYKEVRTPYDNCILVMPATRPAPGHTAVRLGRVVA